jgi:hypothetical protein
MLCDWARTYLVVIGAGEEVGLVPARVVVDTVDALLVALKREMRRVRAQAPHLQVYMESRQSRAVLWCVVCVDLIRTLMVRSREAEAKTPVSLGLNLTIMT